MNESTEPTPQKSTELIPEKTTEAGEEPVRNEPTDLAIEKSLRPVVGK